MKVSFWQIVTVPLVIAVAAGIWLLAEEEPEMKASVSVAEAMGGGDLEGYLRATGPREFVFPDDHGPHPGFKTEWWYYTGNLFAEDGRQYGYQFTIFRNQMNPPTEKDSENAESNWSTDQLYLGHFAISDVANEDHVFEERYSRGTAGLAGAETEPYRIWLEDWEIRRVGDDAGSDENFPVTVTARMEDGTAIDLEITPDKPLVLQGDRGYDKKGSGEGNASYYISFTRMETKGSITKDGETVQVAGQSWMDHEWSTSALDEGQTGWDWFSIQLDNGYELMYYQIRNDDGTVSPQTTGSLIDPQGNKIHLENGEVTLEVMDSWKSPHTTSAYPQKWIMHFPEEDMRLEIATLFEDQEMAVSVQYYEGALSVSGTINGELIEGNGYIEMTGYEE